MANNANIKYHDATLFLSGELDFNSVVGLWNQSLPLFAKSNDLQIDLAHVTSSNSAALALLIEWVKLARQKNKSIQFKNIPSQLLSIAAVSGIDEMLV